jgi:predicted HicB family RNase H-like nuclease|tara:strand:- start:1273 stop:1497 length:225 start_codon:yes stop_codon:yes gene_type:complete
MPLQTQTSSEFFVKIQELVKQTNLSYMDAVLHYCDMNGMEPETAAQLVNGKLKVQIREEAEELNFFPKTAKLPI